MKKKILTYVAGACLLLMLVLVIGLSLFETLNPWGWVAAMYIGGLLLLGAYTINRSVKLLLVPSYILLVLALLSTLLSLDLLRNHFIPTFVSAAIAFPFVMAYLKSKPKKMGLLVPVYFLSIVSLFIPLLEIGLLTGIAVPSFVLLSIAAPFFILYVRSPMRWWALILGGIPFVIGVSLLISKQSARYTTPAVLILSGLWMVSRLFNQKVPKTENVSQRIMFETILVAGISLSGMWFLPAAKTSFALVPVVYLLVERRIRNRSWSELGFSTRSFWADLKANWLLFILLGFVIQPVVVLWARSFYPEYLAHIQARLPFESGINWGMLLPLLAFSLLSEELTYRVLIQGRFTPFFGVPAAIGVTSLLFGLAHFAPGSTLVVLTDVGLIMVSSVLYGIMFARRINIWPVWLAHLLGDILGLLAIGFL